MNSIDSLDEMEYNAAYAMLTCHANTDKLQSEEPATFIKRAIKMGHESILEHITLTFEVNDLSRACLQELARHRHISLSVESTRHTLRKQCNKGEYRISDYAEAFTVTNSKINGEWKLDELIIDLIDCAMKDNPDTLNDELKYYLPEFWATNLVLTLNIRELRHILKLRTSPAALQEFQDLAHKLFDAVPDDYRYMLEDCICKPACLSTNYPV